MILAQVAKVSMRKGETYFWFYIILNQYFLHIWHLKHEQIKYSIVIKQSISWPLNCTSQQHDLRWMVEGKCTRICLRCFELVGSSLYICIEFRRLSSSLCLYFFDPKPANPQMCSGIPCIGYRPNYIHQGILHSFLDTWSKAEGKYSSRHPKSKDLCKDIAFCWHPNILVLGMTCNNLHKDRRDIDSLSQSKLF